ncbi:MULTISPECIES: Mu transposase C-terminal domain-containing protein [unclassified Caballeronia]|uniref:Mu transposase C-terminal domain-containing protein n=1 Tax=unclassified Caballeronia TaxID=2646786 RepID=UPI002027D8C3|nr:MULTISPECIES: Mu transposase C-terminal domain-containing protein [unclassified Caballeronia]MDR5768092.1 Mu transposase C-terminal domain-containing protein [Caballeronia sp. LZ028]
MGGAEIQANHQAVDDHAIIERIQTGGDLTEEQLQSILRVAGVLPLGQALIREIRRRPPDTAPMSDPLIRNTTGRYPSLTMRRSMQFGSVFPELCALFMADSRLLNPNIVEFWNRIRLRGVETFDASGRRCGPVSRPMHALVIERKEVYFLEVRRDSELEKSSLFKLQEDGTWVSPSTEAAAARYGIGYKLVPESRLGVHLQGNLSVLSSCYLPDYRKPDEEEIRRVVQAVRERGVVRRKDLVAEGNGGESIKYAVAHGAVYFALYERDFTNTETAYLYADRESYISHQLEQRAQGALAPPPHRPLPVDRQTFTWDRRTWIVVNAGDSKYWVRNEQGVAIDLKIEEVRDLCARNEWVYEAVAPPKIMRISQKRRAEAVALFELIGRPISEWKWPYGAHVNEQISPSTISRIQRDVRTAELEGRSVIDALVRNYDNCGCRFDRVEEGEHPVWLECLRDDYLHNIAPTFASVKRIYDARCQAAGVTPVSDETIRRRLKRLDKAIIVQEQDGRFQAYSYGSFVPRDKINRLVKGRIPWEVAHIDHSPLPVTLICSVTGRVQTRRAWRSVMRDAATFRVIAHVIHYGVPSYETLYRLLLEAVRRHQGRMPQYIVCDRALEFQAKQFSATIARYYITKLNRPARTPRSGQPVEAGFRKDDAETVMNIAGHAKPDVDWRNLLEEFSISETATHTLTEIRELFDKKYYEIEPRHSSSRTGHESILDYEERILANVGRSHIRVIRDDLEFRHLCMPAVPGGYRKVRQDGGVEACTNEYFSAELKDPEIKGTFVLVRYDPDNIGRVVVWAKEHWIECRSNHYEVLCQFSHLELLAYQEYLRGEGETKSDKRHARGLELGKSLLEMREKAEGRVSQGMALENTGKTYVPGVTSKVESVPSDQTPTKPKNKPLPNPDGLSLEEELEIAGNEPWSEEDIPTFKAYADRR